MKHKKKKRTAAPAAKQPAAPAAKQPAVANGERSRSGWLLTAGGLLWMAAAFAAGHPGAATPGACILGLGIGTLIRSRRKRPAQPRTLRDDRSGGR